MNYSSGAWGLSSISVAQILPANTILWLVARVLLDAAGGLFLAYLLALHCLTTIAVLSPRNRAERSLPLHAGALGDRHRGARGRHAGGRR